MTELTNNQLDILENKYGIIPTQQEINELRLQQQQRQKQQMSRTYPNSLQNNLMSMANMIHADTEKQIEESNKRKKTTSPSQDLKNQENEINKIPNVFVYVQSICLCLHTTTFLKFKNSQS